LFVILKAVDLSQLLQEAQLYWAFPFSEDFP